MVRVRCGVPGSAFGIFIFEMDLLYVDVDGDDG